MIHLKNSKHNLLITIYALLIDVFCNYFHNIFFLNYRVKLQIESFSTLHI